MPKINVAKAFRLKLAPQADFLAFAVGEHDVSDEVAEHWYTKEHLAKDAADDVEAAPVEPVAETEADLTEDEAVDPAEEVTDPDASLDDTAVQEADPPAEVAEDEVAAEDDAALLDAMNDDELRAFITKRDGKAPHHMLGHDKLLALAKG